jgi:hypothetical protein
MPFSSGLYPVCVPVNQPAAPKNHQEPLQGVCPHFLPGLPVFVRLAAVDARIVWLQNSAVERIAKEHLNLRRSYT